ncbi:MAG: hypothetical protein WHX52_10420 [Anaerolineae bacterium]
MRLIINESQVKTRTRMGEIAPLLGFGFGVGGIVLMFWKPEWFWIASIIVWVGLLASLIGTYFVGRYVGPLAHHKRVPEALKGLENSFTLLVYKTPAPFVLVDGGGLTVIFVRSQGGRITYANGKWKQQEKMGALKRFAGQEGLGRPEQMAQVELDDLRRFLRKRLPEGVEIPLRAVILFVHPDVVLEVENPPLPVFRTSELKRWLRKEGRRPNLPQETLAQLYAALGIAAEE